MKNFVLILSLSVTQVNLTINRCMHACVRMCVSQLHCYFYRYLSINKILDAWCFCWCYEHVSGASLCFRDKMNQSDPIPADSHLCIRLTAWNLLRFVIIILNNSIFLLINLKPDIVDGQTIQNYHLFFNIGQAIDQLFFSSSNCF